MEPSGINSSIDLCRAYIAAGQEVKRYQAYLDELLKAKAELDVSVYHSQIIHTTGTTLRESHPAFPRMYTSGSGV